MPGETAGKSPEPRFFRSAAEFRKWLAREHGRQQELWVGYYKAGASTRGITYPESVDIALCFGWIDGVRRSVDGERYTNRFTPRRPGSHWSEKNIARMQELIAAGLVAPAGLAAFGAGTAERSGRYEYGREHPASLPPQYEQRLHANPDAHAYFEARPPGYRRITIDWVMSAKREETRERRLQALIDASAQGQPIGPLAPADPARRDR